MLFLLFVLIASVQGLTLKTTSDHLVLSGTVGEFYAYSSEDSRFSVKADYFIAEVVQGGDHAKIRVVAPSCLAGTEEITVIAQSTTSRAEKRVWVTNEPREACSAYIKAQPPQQALSRPTSLFFTHAFDPTSYSVRFKAFEGCRPVNVGETVVEKITAINEGASGTFQLTADAQLDIEKISLQMNEAEEVTLRFKPERDGRFFVKIRALRGNVQVGSGEVCFEARHAYKAILDVPKRVEVKACELGLIELSLKNTGTGPDSYVVEAENTHGARVALSHGETAKITLPLNASSLRVNENILLVSAKSENVEEEAEAPIVVNVSPCAPLFSSKAMQNQTGDVLTFTALVRNEQDTPMRNVTLGVSGVPSAWNFTSETKTIPPHSETNITATLARATDEEAIPVLSVYADGKKIAEHSLEKIPAKPSLTGRLISGAAENAPWVVLVLLLAAAAFMLLRGRAPEKIDNGPPGRQQTLQNIQSELDKEGYA